MDADAGENGVVRYRLSAGRYGSVFAVDELSGAVTLRRRLSDSRRPSDGVYRLRVAAVDDGAEPRRAYTDLVVNVVDVNNHAPTIQLSGDSRLQVLENQPPATKVRI